MSLSSSPSPRTPSSSNGRRGRQGVGSTHSNSGSELWTAHGTLQARSRAFGRACLLCAVILAKPVTASIKAAGVLGQNKVKNQCLR